MIVDPVKIEFQNSQNPQAQFDLLDLKDMFGRTYEDHSPFQLHRVTFYLIILIEKGSGVHTIDFKNHTYQPGTVLTIRKDQIHKFYKNNSVKGSLLLFTDEFLVSYLEQLEALKSLQLFNEVLEEPKIQLNKGELTEMKKAILRLKNEYFQVKDDYSFGILRSELHILITKLFRIKSKKSPLIGNPKYLNAFIDFQNLVEAEVSQNTQVQYYAKQLAMSTKTLNTITKKIIHKSAKAFIDDICTKQIKRLLINTNLSIKEIAYTMGFEESTNFYKYFKRQTNTTPDHFRNTFQ